MAEVMVSDRFRDSLQSLEGIAKEESNEELSSSILHDNNIPTEDSTKRVKHGPTTVIQIPEKRRKISTSVAARQVVESINRAVSPEDRREALCTAMVSFDHNMQSLHDEELEIGADAALVKHLGYLIAKRGDDATRVDASIMNETSNTCEALEMVYRASPHSILPSFERVGLELLAMLIRLIGEEVSERMKSENDEGQQLQTDMEGSSDVETRDNCDNGDPAGSRSVTPPSEQCPAIADESGMRENDMMLRKATKILGHYARVGAATQPMAYFPGLLSCLINILMIQPYNLVPAEARLNSLWILANVACNSDNMIMMACHPNLISTLVATAGRKVESNDRAEVAVEIFRSQSIATRALVNLSWAPENRIPMAENQLLLSVLTKLAVYRESPFGKKGRTVQDMILQTRKHSIGTIRNLASAPRRSKIQLCHFQQGKILNAMTDAVLNDPDESVKERAFATIQNLAIHDTAGLIVQNPALVLALKDALLSSEETPMKSSASATLLVLERSITPDMVQYQTLRELLDSLNPSNEADAGSESDSNDQVQVTSV